MSAAQALTAFLAERESGQDVRTQNVSATQTLANIMKTSLGPNGLDKMLVDTIGEMTITNDGATILRQLEVQHPAAKVLVDLSELQDQEVGDGTTSVVLLAAELLKRGNNLIERGVHPTWVLSAFKTAAKEAVSYIENNLTVRVDPGFGVSGNRASTSSATGSAGASVECAGTDLLMQIAKTSLASKLIGGDSEFFARLVYEAIMKVRTVEDLSGQSNAQSTSSSSGSAVRVRYPVKAVSILKTHGRSIRESFVVDGFALSHTGRACQGMPMKVENARIAVLEFTLKQYRAQMGVQVLVQEAEELEAIRQKEKDITKKRVEKILDAGATVILTSEGIDDMALKYFVDRKALAVRRVPKAELRRIARATGAKPVLTMSSPDSEEEGFDPKWLGFAREVAEERVGDWDYIFIKGGGNTCAGPEQSTSGPSATTAVKDPNTSVAPGGASVGAASIIIRGANDYLCDEVERCVHDALCAVSRTLESELCCVGGGSVEAALSIYLEDFARTMGSKQQVAISEFAEALNIIPKTLAYNAAKDSADLLAKLRAKHYLSQKSGNTSEQQQYKWFGLDLAEGKIRNNLEAGVLEPVTVKTKAIRFATEAAVTILRVDDVIKCHPEEQPQQANQ